MRVQNLYSGTTGSNRLTGAGYITKIGFKADSNVVTAFTCTGVTIKMGHTSLASLTTTYANNVEQGKGSVVTVAQDKTVTIPVLSAGDYISIDLTTPFYYNGVDNLVVDYIRAGTCTGTVSLMYDNTAPFDEALQGSSITAATASLTAPINIKFTFAGGDDAVNFGTALPYVAPFVNDTSVRHVQILYSAASISGSGPITGIGMVVNGVPSGATYTATIKMGHSVLSALTTTYAANFSSAPVTVADALVFTVPANVPSGSTLWLPVTGSFNYNGTDNLIVDIDVTGATGDTYWAYTSGFSNGSVFGPTGSATGGISVGGHQTKFRFNGGKMIAGLGAGSNASQALGSGTAGQIQSLYNSTMLGTSGTINAVYLRLDSSSTPTSASLTNYKMYMGHTTKEILSWADTYASNMDENAAVFTGTLTVPAGLKAGDWVKIPLSSPFAYDARKNLSILFATDAGPDGNRVSGTAYASVMSVGRNDNTVLTPTWNWTDVLDLAVDISK